VIAMNGIIKKGEVQPGQKVLINGAGGSAGTFAVQLAKLHGAEVTGVDNTYKVDFLRSLGADHVIDHTRENFTKSGKRFDLILDLIAHRSAFAYARALKPNGTYFFTGGSVATLFQILFFGSLIRRMTSKNIRMLMVPQNREDLIAITELVEAGKINVVIDRTYSFDEIPEAMRYVSEGRAKGKVVITVE
jgi:NADPH:quinone reductase-like Zn-dependent oxidoreductase